MSKLAALDSILYRVLLCAIAGMLTSCSSTTHLFNDAMEQASTMRTSSRVLHRHLSKEDSYHVNYVGRYKVGNKYVVRGRKYSPKVPGRYTQYGIASWYGTKDGFHGRKTANGDTFNTLALTGAHPSLPLPSLVKITNRENNKSVIVLINDRGPFKSRRILDVSEQAAKLLSFYNKGTAKVRLQYLHRETQEFLKMINLAPETGATAKPRTQLKTCSINCLVKLVNMKYHYPIALNSR